MEVLALPFVGAVVSPLLAVGIYRYARRHFHKTDTLSSRAFYFYRMMAGVLGGLFLCQLISHTYLTPAIEYRFFIMFLFVGYFVVGEWAETIGNVWNNNPDYVPSPGDNLDVQDVAYNRETNEQENVVVVTDLASPLTAQQLWMSIDAAKKFTKRRWMLGAMLCIFTVAGVADGLLIVVRLQAGLVARASLIVCYYANGIAMSVVVFWAMVHSRLHVEENRIRLWIVVGGAWCVALTCCSIPALVSVDTAFIQSVLNSRYYVALNGVAAGGLLKLHVYYHGMETPRTNWRPSMWGALVCTVAALQSALTGVFL
jgi:hypothetical protein